MPEKLTNQVVGNIGLYYVCYRLSMLGWNVMPTARNARGIDIVIYSQDALRTHTVQVKALSKRSAVPLARDGGRPLGNYFVVCRLIAPSPECFILIPDEVVRLRHRTEKNGNQAYWMEPKQ